MPTTRFTTITPLPAGISRETVLSTLHSAEEMIDLNPSHEARVPAKPPPEASPEEYHCKWYQITDKVSYLPAGMVTGKVHFKACFHNLPMGLQTHVYAPMGLDIKEKWTLGGNLPHEPVQPMEIGVGAPISGLYLREDVEMKCNFLMTRFVRKTLKDALATLVARLVVKSQLVEAVNENRRLITYDPSTSPISPPLSPPISLGQTFTPLMSPPPTGRLSMPMEYPPKWAEAHAQQQQQQGQWTDAQARQMQGGQVSPKLYAQPQYSPQYPTQQYHQQMIQQQKAMGQAQGVSSQLNQFIAELDDNQKSTGVQHGPAELP